jgi:hypothetical protein
MPQNSPETLDAVTRFLTACTGFLVALKGVGWVRRWTRAKPKPKPRILLRPTRKKRRAW